MLAILTLFVVVVTSILVTKVATIALIHTGLSRESARFQARSAFTGAGFTTSESERVVNHPVRRRIIMFLMLLGNAGLVTAVSSLIITFVGPGQEGQQYTKVVLLLSGLLFLWGFSSSPWVNRHLSRVIDRGLKRYTHVDARDYASIMHLVGDYRLAELQVQPDDWMAGKSLAELELRDEGVVVLGIKRKNGRYIGVPNGDSMVESEDTLLVYGREHAIAALDRRRASMTAELRHDRAVAEQEEVEEVEREEQEKEKDAEKPPDDEQTDPSRG